MKLIYNFYLLILFLSSSFICFSQEGSIVSQSSSKLKFSEPIDIPTGPEGISIKGGLSIPNMKGEPGFGAPAISAISEITFPDETLVISGEGLDGCDLVIWTEGFLFEIKPLRVANNRMQAIVPAAVTSSGVTRKVPKSTMLVWPVKGDKTGVPIRVNAPASWWIWPKKVFAGPEPVTIKLFGKNLIMENEKPVMVIQHEQGKPQMIEIVDSNPYCLEGKLPDGLPLGKYRVWANNGTGGNYGWSDTISFEIERGNENPTKVFFVDNYRKESKNDTEAVKRSIEDAVKNGGGIVQFSSGVYNVNEIIIPENSPITLRGNGMGIYDWSTHLFDEKSGTIIKDPFDRFNFDKIFIRLIGGNSRIENLTLSINGLGRESAVSLEGANQTIEGVRILNYSRYVNGNTAIKCSFEGIANHQILNCELLLSDVGIKIERKIFGTDYVRIENNKFIGNYSLGKANGNQAIDNFGGSQIIILNNHFSGLDPEHGHILNRTYVMHTHAISNCYVANNISIKVGSHGSVPGLDSNTGEQYLTHPGGGTFAKSYKILNADKDHVTVSNKLDLPSQKPSNHLTGEKGQWIVYVAKGRGVGQWRIVSDVNKAEISLTNSWRVIPDSSSIVMITRVNRQNIFYKNFIDGTMSHIPGKVPKTSGIYLYHNALDNIIANNYLKGLGNGIAIFTDGVTPACWNVTRENILENIKGKALGTSPHPMFYAENLDSPKPVDYWAMVGNVCRSNTGNIADVAAMVSFKWGYLPDDKFLPGFDNGIIMSVIENNKFTGVDRGILLSSPSNWSLIRNNNILLSNTNRYKQNIEQISKSVFEPLIMFPDSKAKLSR